MNTIKAALTAEFVQRLDVDDLVLPRGNDNGLVTGLNGVRVSASGFSHFSFRVRFKLLFDEYRVRELIRMRKAQLRIYIREH